ncbi:MFS transporter [Arsenicicoccus dermatophilus]|uniref:MFS transporter n=1 Tax=Arsenicicoccus dermatophilus TaxID=1076331 RepID=UPI0039171343
MPPDARGVADAHPRVLLAAASLAVLLAAADTYVVVLALPDMMAGVGLGIDAMQRATPIISGFLLGYVVVLPLVGRLADLVDRPRVLRALLVVFLVGSVVTALATELPVLVGGRVLQGLGGGGLVPATLALVADGWPPARRGVPLGVVGAVQELGSVVGPLLGAAVLAAGTWRDVFWLNAALAAVLWCAVAALTRRGGAARSTAPDVVVPARPAPGASSRTRPARGSSFPHRGGRALSAGIRHLLPGLALAALVLALWAPEALVTHLTWGWGYLPLGSRARLATPLGAGAAVLVLAWLGLSWRGWTPVLRQVDVVATLLVAGALGCLVLTFATADPAVQVVGPQGPWLLPLGALCTAGWVVRHRTAAVPLVPRGLLRRVGATALVLSLLVGAALAAVVVDVPVLARLTVAGTQAAAAMVLLRFLVALPVGALLGGLLLRRVGPSWVSAAGLALAALGLAEMARWTTGSLTSGSATPTLALVGLGLGLALAPVNAAALAEVAPESHGSMSALVVLARMVGMIVGLALLTAIGLRRFYAATTHLPDPGDPAVLLTAALVQVQTVFWGAAGCAALAAVLSLTLRGRSVPDRS